MMAKQSKTTVWYWARLAVLFSVGLGVAMAGTDDWQWFLPGALFIIGGGLLMICGVFQWIVLAQAKRLLPAGRRSLPYSLSVNPFGGECFFITGFIPYVALAIAGGLAIAVVIDGFWPLFWNVGVLIVIASFWIRWNGLLARRYCR